MADRAPSPPEPPAPAVILIEPQLAMNIGTTARAMLNCGLSDLRLVRPKPKWPNEMAKRASSGAEAVLEAASLFDSAEAAIADLNRVFATSGRHRKMVKRIFTPREAAQTLRAEAGAGIRAGILFGPERTGLENDEMALADAAIHVPLNPHFASLNLAQAVLLIGYEWFQAGVDAKPLRLEHGDSPLASKDDLANFFTHLERELDECGFLRLPDKRPGMVRNIRNIFQRADLTRQEVRTLHGIVTELVTKRKGRPIPD